MPGRGQPWKGVGKGNPDRIGSGAIADGSITEADLDSSVTSKLNSTGHVIQEEGTPLTQQSNLNFTGAGVTASVGGEDTTVVTIAGGGYDIIEDEGTPLTQRTELNFVGAGVVASDDGEKTVVTIAGGGGGSTSSDIDTCRFWDDFFYFDPATVLENLIYELVGTGSLTTAVSLGRLGVIKINTSAISGENTTLNTSGDNRGAFGEGVDVTAEFVVRVTDQSAVVIIGLGENVPSNGTTLAVVEGGISNGAYFAYDAGGGNWLCRNANGGVTSVDSGVAVANDTFKLKLVFSNSSSNVTYFINNSQVAQISTNVPDSDGLMFVSVNPPASVSDAIELDYWKLIQDR